MIGVPAGIVLAEGRLVEGLGFMDFNELMLSLGKEMGIELDGSAGGSGFTVQDMDILMHNAGEMIFIRVDLGKPAGGSKNDFLKQALNSCHLYRDTCGSVFALSPEGHLHLQRYEWMARLDGKALHTLLREFINVAAAWKKLLEDFCAVRGGDPEDSDQNSAPAAEFKISDIASQGMYMV